MVYVYLRRYDMNMIACKLRIIKGTCIVCVRSDGGGFEPARDGRGGGGSRSDA